MSAKLVAIVEAIAYTQSYRSGKYVHNHDKQ